MNGLQKAKRKHRPVRLYPIIQQTQHEYIKTHRQMIITQVIINYDNNSQVHSHTIIVGQGSRRGVP
jgi:hypothetical protein